MSKTKGYDKASLILYDALIKAIKREKIAIVVDVDWIDRVKSPLFNPWETVFPLIVILVISLIIMLFSGLLTGTSVMLVGLISWRVLSKPIMEKKIEKRLINYISISYANWQKMWKFGGFILVCENIFKSRCFANKGDWREFTVLNLADELKAKDDDKIL